MPMAEPSGWTRERSDRLAQQNPLLKLAGSANTLMGVDAMRSSQGVPPSPFSQSVMRLGAAAAKETNTP